VLPTSSQRYRCVFDVRGPTKRVRVALCVTRDGDSAAVAPAL
jgi:hypothetical protein